MLTNVTQPFGRLARGGAMGHSALEYESCRPSTIPLLFLSVGSGSATPSHGDFLMTIWKHATHLYLLASASLAFACSGSADPNSLNDNVGGADANGDDVEDEDTGIDMTHTGGGGQTTPGGADCDADTPCSADAVCHPTNHQCVAPGSNCSQHSDCGDEDYCESSLGVCLPGVAGSSCEQDSNCMDGSTCSDGVCACSGFQLEQDTDQSPLDIYFMFDRTGSMGRDCSYVPGQQPSVDSKACYATYALSDYLTNNQPEVSTRLAFQFMSYEDGCDGTPYSTPYVDLTELPVPLDHTLIQAIDNETFRGGSGTQIEGALIGISNFTKAAQTPGREMIGVLMTDGDPVGCNENVDDLAAIIAQHYAETGIRTFIIGMDGATEANLEKLAIAGGAEPHDDFCGTLEGPCHYWNVGDGAGSAIADALQAIAKQAVPLPCDYALADITPPAGTKLDLKTLNVQLVQDGTATVIGNVTDQDQCPLVQPAWYYDNATTPQNIVLCPRACDVVSAAEQGAKMNVVGGCTETVIIR